MSLIARFSVLLFALIPILCPLGSYALTPQPDGGQFRDSRIYLDFTASVPYHNDPSLQDKLRRGIELGLHMWQSVLPGITFHWVDDPSQANFFITIRDYRDPASRVGTNCPNDNFTGCGFGNNVWLNDYGFDYYRFEEKDLVPRANIYNSYVPATYPPIGYDQKTNTIGYITGTYDMDASNDISMIFLHEFGHCLGMKHDGITTQQIQDWYGKLKDQSGATPASNQIYPDLSQYPGLPSPYYGGGTQQAPYINTLDPLNPAALTHWFGTDAMMGGKAPAGIPLPPWAAYNSRAFYASDLTNPGLSAYKFQNTKSPGLILMYRPYPDQRYLTNDWTDALAKSQLANLYQIQPFFVMDIHPQVKSRSRLAAGNLHSLAIREDGSLWAWGDNTYGQLGNGTINASTFPVHIGSATNWIAVAAGDNFSVALNSNGAVYAWGRNVYGILGNGSVNNTLTSPGQVCAYSGQACYGNKYVALAAGSNHVLALRNDGTIWGWGLNTSGQLGDNSFSNKYYPTKEATGSNQWAAVAAGGYHSMGLNVSGNIYCWGQNGYGQLGNGNTSNANTPQQEATWSSDWSEVLAGRYFSMGRKKNGSLYTWGNNLHAALGNGSVGGYTSYASSVVGEGASPDWADVAVGGYHAGGVKMHGEGFTWGYDGYGQLGDNGSADVTYPGSSSYLANPEWTSIAMGANHTLAFKTNGALYAWGDNSKGQLGNRSNTTSRIPVRTQYGKFPTIAIATPNEFNLNYLVGETIPLTVNTFGNISKVEYYYDANNFIASPPPPYSFNWTTAPRGVHTVTAKLTDVMGTVVTATTTVTVNYVSKWTITTPVAAGTKINLSNTGTVDWMQMGRTGTEINRKSGTNVIQSYVWFPYTTLRWAGNYTNSPGFYWSDGKTSPSPLVGSVSSTSPVYTGFQPSGLQDNMELDLKVNEESTNRTLNLYVRAFNMDVTATAVTPSGVKQSSATWYNANGVAMLSVSYGPAQLPTTLAVHLGVYQHPGTTAQLQVLAATVVPAP